MQAKLKANWKPVCLPLIIDMATVRSQGKIQVMTSTLQTKDKRRGRVKKSRLKERIEMEERNLKEKKLEEN